MPTATADLRILLYDGYAKTNLLDELTGRWRILKFSSALHGGFKLCRIDVPMTLPEAWLYLRRENLRGYHFYHLEITEARRLIWEGRVQDIQLAIEPGFHGLRLTCAGYWASCRDQLYDPADAGNTDWTSGGPHNIDDIIKEMLSGECPDINSDQANIAAQTENVAGIDLTARAYPMDNIVDNLMPLADAQSYFAIWDDRIPYLTARSVDQVDVVVYLEAIRTLRLTQQGKHVRNRVLPVVGTTEGTAADNSDSQSLYPTRHITLSLPAGVPTTAADNARDEALTEKANPRQDTSFIISGSIYSSNLAGPGAATGASQEIPKWRVRAGEVIRIENLVPSAVSSPALDDLRTFFALEVTYDANADTLLVQPDRPEGRLGTLLARIGQLEL